MRLMNPFGPSNVAWQDQQILPDENNVVDVCDELVPTLLGVGFIVPPLSPGVEVVPGDPTAVLFPENILTPETASEPVNPVEEAAVSEAIIADEPASDTTEQPADVSSPEEEEAFKVLEATQEVKPEPARRSRR